MKLCQMRSGLTVCSALLLLLAAYAVSPYVALWRLEQALDHGDAGRLEASVDWKSVREGFKQDIAEGVIGPMQGELAANTLPQFGASFIAGIADNAVDHDVTPQNLIAVMRQMHTGEATHASMNRFAWAFFDSPTSFNVVINMPGTDPDDSHMRLRLELHNGTWRVMRAWIPQDMVERAAQRT